MGKLVVTEFITLDGIIEDPGGSEGTEHGGWSFRHPAPEGQQFKGEELERADAQLLGRVTYEGFAAAWPQQEGEFADLFNGMPKHVATRTLQRFDWNNASPLQGELADAVAELKAGEGAPIYVHGSASIVRALLPAGLVDELRLMIHPVAIGGGKRLFPDDREKLPFRLASTRAFDSGVLLNVYEPAAPA